MKEILTNGYSITLPLHQAFPDKDDALIINELTTVLQNELQEHNYGHVYQITFDGKGSCILYLIFAANDFENATNHVLEILKMLLDTDLEAYDQNFQNQSNEKPPKLH